MSKQKILRPAEGVKVRHPDGFRHLSEQGESVTMNAYWQRRLADGDVVAVNTAAPIEAAVKGTGDGRSKGNRE